MKKLVAIFISLTMSLSLIACSSGEKPVVEDGTTKKQEVNKGEDVTVPKKATVIINGNLGDLGFFDSANKGMQRVKDELGLEIQVIETGDDESKWESALADAADEEPDYVIAVSPSMVEPIQGIAPLYPDTKFLLFDNVVDFDSGKYDNVYCATFKQNEGSYLAGAAAALLAGDTGKIGFVGGMDIPPINDFLVGYIEGALAINESIKVTATYTGDYYDPAKGKEHGIVLLNQGAEVVFPAAGPTGLGVIDAVTSSGKKIIGVDSDQSAGYAANGDEKTASSIATSMLKNVGDAIFRAIELDLEGELRMGTVESLGIAEGGVGLAKNEVYNATFSDEQKQKIEEIEGKVTSGEIKVATAIGMTLEELNTLKGSVSP